MNISNYYDKCVWSDVKLNDRCGISHVWLCFPLPKVDRPRSSFNPWTASFTHFGNTADSLDMRVAPSLIGNPLELSKLYKKHQLLGDHSPSGPHRPKYAKRIPLCDLKGFFRSLQARISAYTSHLVRLLSRLAGHLQSMKRYRLLHDSNPNSISVVQTKLDLCFCVTYIIYTWVCSLLYGFTRRCGKSLIANG